MTKIQTVLALLVASIALTSCATKSFSPFIKDQGEISSSKAYVYGRFELLDTSSVSISLNSYDAIGLRFSCDSEKTFTVGLHPTEFEQIIEAPVGKCSLYEIIFTKGAHSSRAEPEPNRYTGKPLQAITLQPGTLNYIGDIKGKVSYSSQGNTIYTHWNITESKDRFEETSASIANRFPSASSLKLINQFAARRR